MTTSFVVGADHLGTPEAAWLASGHLDRLADMDFGQPRRVVAVAPHPDDEVLGIGGTLRQLAAGGALVDVVIVTDGEASHPHPDARSATALGRRRRSEARQALDRLGLARVEIRHLAMPDGGVEACRDPLTEELAGLLLGADWCLATWRGDGHPDHEAVGTAAAAACVRTGVALGEYPVWAWHWAGAEPDSDEMPWGRARRIVLDTEDLTAKRAAVAAHRSQIEADGRAGTDTAVLPPEVLVRFDRNVEVVFV